MSKYEDLTGKKFGRLTVLEITDKKNNDGRRIWKCLCDCGNIKYTTCQNLKRGHCTSCGCKNKEQITALGHSNGANLIGQHFGKLIVIDRAVDKLPYSDSLTWICQCDCGNQIITTTSRLNSGNTRSCGCSNKSESVEIIKQILNNSNIQFKTEVKVDGLISKNNRPLRFDFYLPEYNCYIEFDGEQHYSTSLANRYTSLDLYERDCLKNQYCLDNNIKLYRIPYSEKQNLIKQNWSIKNILNDDKFLVKQINHYNLPWAINIQS